MEHQIGRDASKNDTDKMIRYVAEDDIVMLVDPDMVLLRPLRHNFTDEEVLWVDGESPRTKVVRHGHPIAQQDGYLTNEWMKLNFSHVTSKLEGQYIHPPTNPDDGPRFWNSGPPYLATVRDFYRIVVRWTEYAPRVLEVFPDIFSEMYGLVIATVQLGLPFTFARSIVVSTTGANDREGWAYVDALPNDRVCADEPGLAVPLPIGLHYCQRYFLGRVRIRHLFSSIAVAPVLFIPLTPPFAFRPSPFIHP